MDSEFGYWTTGISLDFVELLDKLRALKSPDRTERDRKIAVTITEIEKAYAYFKQFVIEE